MGCTMSGGGWCRKRAPVYASGLAAPDDGQYSIPDPYSTTEGKPPAHLKLDVSGTQAGEGTALSTAATRDRSSSRKGSSVSKDLTITPDVPAALHTVRSNESPKAPKKRPRRIPPMLGAIGRSKTERILSMRQKKKLGLRPGLLKDARGIAMGRIEGDGTWVSRNNARQAVFRQDGTIEARDGSVLGAIDANTGSVLDSARSPIGEILADGSVRERNANVGHVTADGVAFNLSGQKLGSCDAGVRGGLLGRVLCRHALHSRAALCPARCVRVHPLLLGVSETAGWCWKACEWQPSPTATQWSQRPQRSHQAGALAPAEIAGAHHPAFFSSPLPCWWRVL